jgi:DNA-binding phage protein
VAPGLIINGRKGILPLLSMERWHDKDYLTVEHIAPQKSAGGWEGKIYEEPETVDLLGNLTLLPGAENGMVGNKSWNHKRALYRALSAESQPDLDKEKMACKNVGLTISLQGEKIFENAAYLPLCKSLGAKKDEWKLDFINDRSKRLAELAYDRISPWLKS